METVAFGRTARRAVHKQCVKKPIGGSTSFTERARTPCRPTRDRGV